MGGAQVGVIGDEAAYMMALAEHKQRNGLAMTHEDELQAQRAAMRREELAQAAPAFTPREQFDALRVAMRAAEAADGSLRVRTVFSTVVDGMPESMPLGYSHPLVELAEFNGYATHDGRVERI